MQKGGASKKIRKPQAQGKPGSQQGMTPKPVIDRPEKPKKLLGKVALITGGDSGIGAAVAVLFAQEGADVAISYLNESEDALEVKRIIEEEYGRTCLMLEGNIRKERFCQKMVDDTVKKLGKLDILVNYAGTQTEQKS